MGEATAEKPRLGVIIHLAALVVIIAGLKAAASIMTLLLVSVFIAMVSAPVVLWFKRKGAPAAVAVLLVVLIVVVMLSGLGVLVGASINGFVKAAPQYKAHLDEQTSVWLDWFEKRGVTSYGVNALKSLEPGSVMSVLGGVFTAVGGMLGNSLLIILVVTFILFEVPGIPAKLKAAFPDAGGSFGNLGRIAGNVERYLALKTVVSLITGALVTLWLTILGVDFPLLWGLLAFLLNYIPTFGSIIAAVPPMLLALLQFGLISGLLVVAGFLVINVVMGNLIEPRLMGRSMGLSTLVVFLSLLLWGSVLGTAGMFLAVPLTMALKIVLESNPETRWLAIFMAPNPATEASPAPSES